MKEEKLIKSLEEAFALIEKLKETLDTKIYKHPDISLVKRVSDGEMFYIIQYRRGAWRNIGLDLRFSEADGKYIYYCDGKFSKDRKVLLGVDEVAIYIKCWDENGNVFYDVENNINHYSDMMIKQILDKKK